MPDKLFSREHTEPWLGVYSQLTPPQSLSKRFFTTLDNVTLHRGQPHTRPGTVALNTSAMGDGSRQVWGMTVWESGSTTLFIVSCGSLLQSVNISTGAVATLTNALPSGFTTRAGGARAVFARLGDMLVISNGVDSDVFYNGTNVSRLGLVAPAALAPPTKSGGPHTGSFTLLCYLS